MKRFENGQLIESDEPPLEHEEWRQQQEYLQAEAAKATARAKRGARAGASDEDEPAGDDRTLYGHKLSVYRRRAADKTGDARVAALMEVEGIGEARATEIAAALDE